MAISMIFKRLGITLFFMACGLFNAWLPDGQIGAREWAAACMWGIAVNLTLLPAHWTAKQQFALAFAVMMMGSFAIFAYFEAMTWVNYFIKPVLVAVISASMATMISQIRKQQN